jgi:ABC-type multidrug transport system ATPase subunit
MLAIGRALMTNPSLLILDEASEGLAPLIREEIWSMLGMPKLEGLSILLIDKNLDELSRISDRYFLIEKGEIAWRSDAAEFAALRAHAEQFCTCRIRPRADRGRAGGSRPAGCGCSLPAGLRTWRRSRPLQQFHRCSGQEFGYTDSGPRTDRG